LSKSFSGLCMWKCIQRESDHQEANPSVRRGVDGKQQIKECKA